MLDQNYAKHWFVKQYAASDSTAGYLTLQVDVLNAQPGDELELHITLELNGTIWQTSQMAWFQLGSRDYESTTAPTQTTTKNGIITTTPSSSTTPDEPQKNGDGNETCQCCNKMDYGWIDRHISRAVMGIICMQSACTGVIIFFIYKWSPYSFSLGNAKKSVQGSRQKKNREGDSMAATQAYDEELIPLQSLPACHGQLPAHAQSQEPASDDFIMT